ncbi:hypothetical protein [Teredinibacter turnerae]|uniref:hypothetical protein n=1 Tax=Teredinibacter turnerae TaxID=2426 RepID=UPI00036F0D4C|nr:hypothetical protein [Teredinibacter turnerae]
MEKAKFLIGAIYSKFEKRPSENFLWFLTALFSLFGLIISAPLAEIYPILPGFIAEWSKVASVSEFSMYLGLFSICLLFKAYAMATAKMAFLSAYKLKNIYGKTFVPNC